MMNWNSKLYCTLVPVLVMSTASCIDQVPLLSIEAEIQEVCIVGLASEFEASTEGIEGIVSRVFGGQDLGITLDERFSAELFLSGVGMTPDGGETGVQSFDFIDSLHVSVSGGGAEPAELLRFDGGKPAVGEDWYIATDSAVDLATYLEADDLQIRFDFAGDLPVMPWTADMEICISVRAAFVEKLPL